MKRLAMSIVAALVATTVAVGAADAGAIVNGDGVDSAPPWMAVVLSNSGPIEGLSHCSGSVIAPRFILTAAHCVVVGTPDAETKLRPSSPDALGDVVPTTVVRPSQRVVAVNTTAADNHDDLGVAAIHVHPQYRTLVHYKQDNKGQPRRVKCDWFDRDKSCRTAQSVGVEWDFAIIELNEPVPAPAAPITLGALDEVVGDTIAYGYGVYQENKQGGGQKSDGALRATRSGDLKRDPSCDVDTWPNVGAVSRERSGWYCVSNGARYTSNGDSGGPHIKWVGSEPVQVGLTSWGGVTRGLVGDVGAARSWIATVAGLAGGGDDILVFGEGYGNVTSNLVTALEGAGHTVAVESALPDDLSPYSAIFGVNWSVGYSDSAEAALEDFVRSGGGLYLTGERPCCGAINASVGDLVSALVLEPGVVVETVDAAYRLDRFALNAAVVYGIDDTPNLVSSIAMDAPGGISGVESENIVVPADDGYAAAAAWGDAELDGGQGRLAVFMDINWLDTDLAAADRDALIVNLGRFLTVR